MTRYNNKIVPLFVILSLLFLFVFNVSYSYFTTTAKITGSSNFGNISLEWIKYSASSSLPQSLNSNQLFPADILIRNGVSGIKLNENDAGATNYLGLRNLAEPAYVRFWVEVYKVYSINGKLYYVDSNGNFVDEQGNYVNINGESVNSSTVEKGELIDYSKYFKLGNLTNGEFTQYDANLIIENEDYVTYFLKDKLQANGLVNLNINAIKLSSNAPDELLDSCVLISLCYEAVQVANGAYVEVFDDDRGFINWENRGV